MKKFLTYIRLSALLTLLIAPSMAAAEVIEVVTFTLKPGVSYELFAPLDTAVEQQHVSKQRGFLSRETARGTNGEWLVLVRWRTAEDADASMSSFMKVPAASGFLDKIDETTMSMKRFTK